MTDEPKSSIPPEKPKAEITFTRIAIWVIVGGIGLYLIISGLIGILVKGS